MAKYLPSHESGEVNILKATITEIEKNNCFSIYTRSDLDNILKENHLKAIYRHVNSCVMNAQ